MSIAALTQWMSVSSPRDGQARFGQRCFTSPSGLTTSTPQSGQCDGIFQVTVPGPVLPRRADDLRNHVAGALHDHEIAFADVLAVDVLLVVQRRGRHRHAADLHRLELCPRIERARPADADVNPVRAW